MKTKDQDILRHEQTHFDISELHARILRQRITNGSIPSIDSVNYVLDDLFGNISQEENFLQKKYDSETVHGANRSSQQEWDDLIQSELSKLDGYADDVVVITFK